jgi:tetratricopeptide (TPR) repeat protein
MKLPLNQGRDRRWIITANDLWRVNYYQGKYQKALACLVEVPGEDAGHSYDRWLRRGLTYLALNQRVNAMSCFDSAHSIAERLPTTAWSKHILAGIALAWRGEHEKARLELEKATSLDLPWHWRIDLEEARVQAALLAGDNDRAMDQIEQLIRQPGLVTAWKLRLDPVYNPLRTNPRFQALLDKSK